MGKIASLEEDISTEKEDVCFIATMLMGIGNTLAEIDESSSKCSPDKKTKEVKVK